VISPLLANIYLHVLDTGFSRRGLGELVRYADDGVVLCRTQAQARAALDAAGEILASLGLRLHPDKTKVVDLREGREGLDFLGCHFHARMSGKLWEQKRIVRYYLHRWPSQRAMKRHPGEGPGPHRPQPRRGEGYPRRDRGPEPAAARLG
jgi:RNA-directed DNA polymerase